jgi:polygalacturonase
VQAKLRETVSVKDFGAVGDGVTDDTAAFGLADASSADSIYVPDGTYVLENFTLNGKQLFGPGKIKMKAASTLPTINLVGRCLLQGLTFDGNRANQTSDVTIVELSAAAETKIIENTFENTRDKVIVSDVASSPRCTIANNQFIDCGSVGGCDVVTVRSSEWIIEGNQFFKVGDGHCIRVGLFTGDPTTTPVTGTVINGNVFKTSLHVAITLELYAQNTTITGNTIDATEAAIKGEVAGGTVFDVTITGNVIKNTLIDTSLNLTVPRVTFNGNTCSNIPGPCDLGDDSTCIGNMFFNCGTITQATINQQSA